MSYFSKVYTILAALILALSLTIPVKAQTPPLLLDAQKTDEQNAESKGISLWQPGDPGQRLFIDGSVLTPDGQGIADAVLYIRQADGNGIYHEDRYRAVLSTDRDGRYGFGTVLPGQYSSTKHIHVYVQHSNYLPMETQILFMGDSNLDESTQRRRGIFLEDSTVDGETFLYGRFDIVLEPSGG